MKQTRFALLAAMLFLHHCAYSAPTYRTGEILVRFAPDNQGKQKKKKQNEILHRHGCGKTDREFKSVDGLCKIKLPPGMDVETALKELKKSCSTGEILYAEPNYIFELCNTPNDTYYQEGRLWNLDIIEAPAAWDIADGSDHDVVVAVLDTGINYYHPDLINNMWINRGEDVDPQGVGSEDFSMPGVEIFGEEHFDNDTNSFPNDVVGYVFSAEWLNVSRHEPDDYMGHGSHVAGIIGAEGNNEEGVIGVCPNVKLMALRVQGTIMPQVEAITAEAVVDSIEYAMNQNVDIFNASWGYRDQGPTDIGYNTNGYSQALYDQIAAAGSNGMLFVAAAGNYGQNIDTTHFYPASYDLDCIISVMATDESDQPAAGEDWATSYGKHDVDLAAPGKEILSCYLRGENYIQDSGTSMAAPHVTGACALLWSYKPGLSNQQVKDILLATADPIPDLENLCASGARLNVYKALQYCRDSAYVDASDAEITMAPAPDGPVGSGIPFAEANETNDLWQLRNDAGIPAGTTVIPVEGSIIAQQDNNSILESAGPARPSNNAPRLKIHIPDLTPASYRVSVCFWTGPEGSNWGIRAGLSDSPGTNSLPLINSESPIATDETGRTLHKAYLGISTGTAIDVFIEDMPAQNADQRTWFDGIACEPADSLAIQPVIQSMQKNDSELTFTWSSEAGYTYRILHKTNLNRCRMVPTRHRLPRRTIQHHRLRLPARRPQRILHDRRKLMKAGISAAPFNTQNLLHQLSGRTLESGIELNYPETEVTHKLPEQEFTGKSAKKSIIPARVPSIR